MSTVENQRPVVVLAETDRENQKHYARVLTNASLDVQVSASAKMTSELLRSRHVDLVITDVMMPRLDGFAVARAVRAQRPSVPIILMTVEPFDNEGLLRASEVNALYLSKPIDAETLLRAVQGRLASRQPQSGARRVAMARETLREVPATTAKNEFGRVLDVAMQDGRVIITKHQRPHAVLLAFEEYERLISSAEPNLDDLTHDFDQLLARMQTPHARAAIDTLFSMSSAELGAAAVDQVTRKP